MEETDTEMGIEGLDAVSVGHGPRVVLAHGFTQSKSSWEPLIDRFSLRHEVVAVDLPGHGGSFRVHASVEEGAALLGRRGGRASYVGYSMGGRHCLRLALDAPEIVEALVVLGANPGIADRDERRSRVESDEALARELIPPLGTGATGVSGSAPQEEGARLESFLRRWLSQPLFSTLAPEAAGLERRLAEATCEGLAASLRLAGTAAQEPLWDRLQGLVPPLLYVVGSQDAKYRALGERVVSAVGPSAELAVIEGAGHAAHLERPERFFEVTEAFLSRCVAPHAARPTANANP